METLKEAYDFLEKNALEETDTNGFVVIFQKIRDFNISIDEEIVKFAQFEIDFFMFHLRSNKLSPSYSYTDDKGELIEYPSITSFNQDTYSYLLKRQSECKTPFLKTYYSHLLWFTPRKNAGFAKEAIKGYLELIKIREQQDIIRPDDNFGLKVLDAVRNAFLLSINLKYAVEIVKSEIIRLIKTYPAASKYSTVLRYKLIEIMVDNKNIFLLDDFSGVSLTAIEIYEEIYKKEDKHTAIDIIKIICKIQKILNKSLKIWEIKIAKIWEELSIEREDSTNLVSTEFCKNAITYYKKVKEIEKVKELENRLTYLKKNVTLTTYGKDFDLTEMINEYRKNAKIISGKDYETILSLLTNDTNIIPTYDEISIKAKKLNEEEPVMRLGSNMIYDKFGNVVQYFSDEDEHDYYSLIWSYDITMKLSKAHLIREIILTCIKNKKITSKNVFAYLNKHSWFGKNLRIQVHGNEEEIYNWISLIAPAIKNYIQTIEFFFVNPVNIPNFILCIDSLTLKVEGILRDFCYINGIVTYDLKKDKKGRNITTEKDVHKLLTDEGIKKFIGEDDLLFFKFLLVEKAGLNLRHKVAHSLLRYDDYKNLNYVNLLFIAILKLGKYDFIT